MKKLTSTFDNITFYEDEVEKAAQYYSIDDAETLEDVADAYNEIWSGEAQGELIVTEV